MRIDVRLEGLEVDGDDLLAVNFTEEFALLAAFLDKFRGVTLVIEEARSREGTRIVLGAA